MSKEYLGVVSPEQDKIWKLEATLRSISYLAHNGHQDRPLWKRLSMIAELADGALEKK